MTFHCVGKKGLFRKRDYSFDYTLEKDPIETIRFVNARNAQRALARAKANVEKYANYFVDQANKLADGKYLIITGHVPPHGDFKWSPNIYGITGVDIELIKIIDCGAWKDQNMKYAMENLSVEDFKTVFGETIPQQEKGIE